MSGPVLIMAGGTGGHVFPALALARVLREKSLEVVWLGTERGLESRVIPAEGIALERLSIGGLRGKGALTWLAAPFRLSVALAQALSVMRRHRPVVVVGLGGFVTGPGGVAAWLARRPLVIHEQNAIAGFTNRCLAHLARRVLEAFPGSFGREVHARAIGNPVRRDISQVPPPGERFAGRAGPLRLLVLGGSQGAARLNAVVPFALARLAGRLGFDVRHQTGERWLEAGRASYAQAGVRADVRPFIEDMGDAYGWADLVDLPCRRAHRVRARGRRRGRGAGALSGRGGRSPGLQRPVSGACRRGGHDRRPRAHPRAAGHGARAPRRRARQALRHGGAGAAAG